MQKRIEIKRQLLLAGCAGLVIASSGCRSAMPKWNMFSWRSAPSAEMLAGDGPTTTYPAPPSESATPDAIASVAGGTSGTAAPQSVASATDPNAPVTGFDVRPTNPAAAQANGFNLAANRTDSNPVPGNGTIPGSTLSGSTLSGKNSSVPALPAGYQFGTRTTPPTPSSDNTGTSSVTSSGTSRYAMPSSYPAPGMPTAGSSTSSGFALPHGATPPSGASMAGSTTTSGTTDFSGLPGVGPAAQPSAATGLALPESALSTTGVTLGGATNAKPFTPKTSGPTSATLTDSTLSDQPNTGFGLPAAGPSAASQSSTPATTVSTGASSPSFSTASAAISTRSSGGLEASSENSYAPGSTSGAGNYPTTSGYPNTGTDGSFYR